MRLSSLAGLMLLLAGLAQAQNPTPFDCQFSGTLTAASPTSAAYFNKGPTAPCVSFRVTYYTTNASGVSLSLQGTGSLPNGNPDTAHWTNLTAQTGSSNPAIGTVSGSISAAYDYYPWIQLTAGTLTGTNATLTYTTLAYKGDSAKLNGGGSITGGPFTSGDVVTGAGGQAIEDSGTLLSSLIVNPMTAVGDMIAGGTSPAGVPTRVPPNVSLVPRVLTQSGDGTNAGQPTWSVIASTTVNGASCALGGSCTANWVSGSIINLHVAQFTGTSGEIQDGGVLGSAASHAATDFQAAGSYVAGASALTTQYNIPIVSGTPGTLMQGGLFNPSGGVLAPMAADSTTAIQLCRHNGTTCDVTYDSTNGRVGIGTTVPNYQLSVVGNSTNGIVWIEVDRPNTSNSGVLNLYKHNSAGVGTTGIGANFGFLTDNSVSGQVITARVSGILTDATSGAEKGALIFDTAVAGSPSERMRIDSNGNVGIGTTTPVYGLDAARSGASGTARFWDQTATTGSTLVTITPGAVQTSASTVFSVGGVVEMLASTFLLNGHTCSIVSTVVTCP